jgi:HSP20 family protein
MVKNGGEIATPGRTPEAVTRWTPFEEFTDLRHRMDDFFSRAFGYTPLSRIIPTEPYNYEPAVDLFETDKELFLYVSVPGFTPESIAVNATADTLNIKGERVSLFTAEAIPRRQDWVTGPCSFAVSYSLPTEIDPKAITATYNDGILRLVMPKSEVAAARTIKVPINAA